MKNKKMIVNLLIYSLLLLFAGTCLYGWFSGNSSTISTLLSLCVAAAGVILWRVMTNTKTESESPETFSLSDSNR